MKIAKRHHRGNKAQIFFFMKALNCREDNNGIDEENYVQTEG